MLKLLALTLFAATAYAKCPNACSGHGTCGEHDMCSCYRNWQSADCSERVCPYHHSFVTTPQGDLNMDGDLMDGNVKRQSAMNDYSDPTPDSATTAQNKLVSIGSPHGTWEAWPAFATAGSDEGHFYMECSNRGLCDRKTGECECFDGYEGRACARTVCPEGCNGHGTCESVAELAATNGKSYNLWDSDKSFSCKCDPGYSGASCASRQCPFGDDPLVTTTYESMYSKQQANEIQFLDIVPTAAQAIDSASYLTLTYTDVFGETWNTTAIQLSATASDTADAIELALEAIPNKVFENVEVTALSSLENFIDGTVTGAAAGVITCANVASSTSCNIKTAVMDDVLPAAYDPIGGWNAAKFATPTVFDQLLSTVTSDTAAVGNTGTDSSVAGAEVINVLRSVNGQRHAIEFQSNSGNLANLNCQVDNSDSTKTSYCHVRTRLPLCHANLEYNSGWQVKTGGTCKLSEAASLTNYLAAGARLTATANTIAATTTGGITASASGASATVQLANDKETYVSFLAAHTAGNLQVYRKGTTGNWQWLGALAAAPSTAGALTLAAVNAAEIFATDTIAIISQGVSLLAACGNNDVTFHTNEAAQASETALDGDKHQDLRGCTPTVGTTTTELAHTTVRLPALFHLNTDGSTERLECGRRGLCDSSTGICSCFKGYTLDDCSLQSVLAS